MEERNGKNEDKVSVIVPSHNVEKYIKRGIDSLISQTYENIEIIVVDDYSEDKTYEILQDIAKSEKRLKVYKNNKHGVSSARNYAMEKASGQYIMFMDSDDEYAHDMVFNMHRVMGEKNIQMAVCNYTNVYDEMNIDNDSYFKEGIVSKRDYLIKDAGYYHKIYFGSTCNKIYQSDIIKENSIKFNEDISMAEDTLFNIDYLKYTYELFVNEERFYKYYRTNQGSLTKTLKPIDTWDTTLKIYKEYMELYAKEQLLDICAKDISYIILSNLMFPVETVMREKNIEFKYAVIKFKEIINNDVVKFGLNTSKKLSLTDKVIKWANITNNYVLAYILLKCKIRVQDITANIKGR